MAGAAESLTISTPALAQAIGFSFPVPVWWRLHHGFDLHNGECRHSQRHGCWSRTGTVDDDGFCRRNDDEPIVTFVIALVGQRTCDFDLIRDGQPDLCLEPRLSVGRVRRVLQGMPSGIIQPLVW